MIILMVSKGGKAMKNKEEYISLKDASDYLGVNRITLYRWAKLKPPKIIIYKKANQSLVKKADIEKIKEEREEIKPLYE
jgi:predicted site-specific integrase-resolvase